MATDIIKTKSFNLAVVSKGDKNSNKLAICLPGRLDTKDYINFTSHIEYFGNKPTLLLGHSRGGQVAMLAGTSNPVVEGFVLVNASYGPPTSPNPEKIQCASIKSLYKTKVIVL